MKKRCTKEKNSKLMTENKTYPPIIKSTFNRANQHNRAGRLKEAEDCYKQILDIYPNIAEVHHNLGLVLQTQGKLDESLVHYQRAININPDTAVVHNNLGAVFQRQGKLDKAIACFHRAIELDHNNLPSAQHMLAALTGKMPKPSATRQYVEGLFDQYSIRYDRDVVEKLEYKVPTLLRQMLNGLFKGVIRFRNAIDLGCGTGLSGIEFRAISDRLSGIDLSPKMLERAREKKIYDSLQVADIVELLNETNEKYDLFIAADVFIYIGDLKPVFNSVRNCSLSGAYFVFSTESCDKNNFILRQTGRYAHNRDYIQSLAKEHNFVIEKCQSAGIRNEKEQWIMGDLFILKHIE